MGIAEIIALVNATKTLAEFVNDIAKEFQDGKETVTLTKENFLKYVSIAKTYHNKRIEAGIVDG